MTGCGILKHFLCLILTVMFLQTTVFAVVSEETLPSFQDPEQGSAFDLDEQLDALGRDELQRQVPDGARELLRQSGDIELSVGKLLQLSPRDFFSTVWKLMLERAQKPVKALAAVTGIIIVCALIGGLKTASGESSLSQTFGLVSILCVLTTVISPILDCIVSASKAVEDAALFMLSYIPMFSASLAASGSPVTGATYNLFLFSACQIVSQIVAKMLVPLLGIYLALCLVASLIPDINIGSATSTIKSIISWTLGFFLTVFVGLLSVQTMVAQSADTLTLRATKFMVGSFVPVVGGALSEALSAAQGCFKLIKTTLGAYGVIVSIFIFLPALLDAMAWYILTNIAVMVGDIMGVPRVSEILRACASVLGIIIAIILCFALLVIVSTTVVMVTGMGTA